MSISIPLQVHYVAIGRKNEKDSGQNLYLDDSPSKEDKLGYKGVP
ncbi:hypothetical protein [Paucisalibacillus sp. EB02]|nr:hypothetical protein [Paucisalibacillus sp. EB02]